MLCSYPKMVNILLAGGQDTSHLTLIKRFSPDFMPAKEALLFKARNAWILAISWPALVPQLPTFPMQYVSALDWPGDSVGLIYSTADRHRFY